MLRGERLGVIALAFVGSGRRVTPRVVDAVVGLAGRAAMALDNARRWSEQRRVVQALVAALLPHQLPFGLRRYTEVGCPLHPCRRRRGR